MRIVAASGLLGILVLIAAAFGRYQIHSANESMIYRIDRLTGRLEVCVPWRGEWARTADTRKREEAHRSAVAEYEASLPNEQRSPLRGDFETIAEFIAALEAHREKFPETESNRPELDVEPDYEWRPKDAHAQHQPDWCAAEIRV